MDRFEAMEYFVATVEAGSFTAAGRRLNIPLPTVSRRLAELEAHLNTQLLVRSTRKLALTEAGVSYLAACKRILDQVGEAKFRLPESITFLVVVLRSRRRLFSVGFMSFQSSPRSWPSIRK